MQNQDEGPRYTDPGHPYSGSDGRYQNQYSNRSRPADKPFQFPWWAIVIPFCIGMWPVGIAFIIMNKLMKEGRMADFEERARQRTSQFTHTSRTTTGSDGRTVYEAQFRRVDESRTSTSRNADANTPIYGGGPPPQSTVEAAEKQGKKAGAATALTVAGIILLLGALIALPDGIFWLPDALAEGGYYWRWLIEDSMPMLIAAAGGLGCLFGAHKLRTGRTMCGALLDYITTPNKDFQPMGANMGILPRTEEINTIRDKRERYAALSQNAQNAMHAWVEEYK